MLVSQIIGAVRTIISDKDSLQVSDAEMIVWINQAMREIAVDNDLLQKSATSATVVGTSNYALPADILRLHSIKYDNDKLAILSRKEAEETLDFNNTGNGTPSISYVWAGSLYLFPAPNAVKNLLVDYIRTPVEVAVVGDTPELPPHYHNRLIDYCLSQAYLQDGDQNMYLTKLNEFKTGVKEVKDEPEWQADSYPSFAISDRDSGVDGFW